MSHRTGQKGFTLIELLIVVAIIGIVAAIAIPSLMNAVDRSKQKATMADMKSLGTAIEHYAIDSNCYPMVSDIDALAAELEPLYMPKVPRTDGWGHALIYEQAATPGEGYTLKSVGKDGSPQASPPGGVIHRFEDDIIYADGAFVQEPAGRQE